MRSLRRRTYTSGCEALPSLPGMRVTFPPRERSQANWAVRNWQGLNIMGFMSNALRDAAASSSFWIVLAIILILAIVGYIVTRRAAGDRSAVGEEGKVVHDWIPTGRIDFAGPSLNESAADTPASFYLQAEDIRLLISFSGIERKEIRWRRATLNEAKRVVNVFHRQRAKGPDEITKTATSAATPSDAENTASVDRTAASAGLTEAGGDPP
jgi:hypothetical protein